MQMHYQDYSDSGLLWAGSIPAHWTIAPVRAIFYERKERNIGPRTHNILSVMKDVGVIPYDEKGNVGNKMSEDIERYKVVHNGDLVINKMNAIIGSLGISKYDGALSQIYIVLYPRNPEKNNNRYLGYLFGVRPLQKSLITISKGMMELRESIEFNEFKKLPLILPPIEEQSRIVAFLDKKIEAIEVAIEKKKKLIELLKEQKAILINQAVTKGLDPNVPMKESGMEWVGKIPEHWDIAATRRFITRIEQGHSPAIENSHHEGEYSVAKISIVKDGRFVSSQVKAIPRRHYFPKYQIKAGDFLLTRGNTPELVADACFVSSATDSPVMLSDLLYRILFVRNKIDSQYMAYLFQTPLIRNQVRICARGSSSTMVKVSQEHIKSWIVICPPLNEQGEISAYLDKLESKFETGISQQVTGIARLKEFKQTLIAHAVTGKIKVPGVLELAQKPSKNVPVEFIRSVIAAEIVSRLHVHPTFGTVKCQKLIFLSEAYLGINEMSGNYHRHAAGPHDGNMMRSVKSQLKKQKWFDARKIDNRTVFIPLEKVGGHKKYAHYWEKYEPNFSNLIEKLSTFNTERCEIIATLFAAWNDLLLENKNPTEPAILNEVLNRWTEEKRRIPEARWKQELAWMQKEQIVPFGLEVKTQVKEVR